MNKQSDSVKGKVANWGDDPELSGPRDWFRNSLIIREVQKRKKGGYLLDFGCGNGNLILRLVNKFKCTGIDASKIGIHNLRIKLKKRDLLSKVKIKIGTEKSILRLKKKYDVVTCGETLEHLANDRLVVNNLFKLLKKDGICVVTVPAHPNLWDLTDDYSGHIRRYTKEGLSILFKKAGFTIEDVYYYGFPLGYIWHKLVWYYTFKIKVEKNKIYSFKPNLFSEMLSLELLKKILSFVFWPDLLFKQINFGNSLILVART